MNLLLLFVLVGLVTIALAIPLALRKVPPNGSYGVIVRATRADEAVWYEANARSGRDLIIVGASFVVVAVVLSRLGLSETVYSSVSGILLVVALIVAGIRGWLVAERLLRGKTDGRASR